MDQILTLLDQANFDMELFVKAAAMLAICTLLMGFIGRFVFGKRSGLNHAVSSAIGILFIYIATVTIYSAGSDLEPLKAFLSPLPYVSIENGQLMFFSFENADFYVICSQVLSMVILAFLVNLMDSWIPKGKNLFTWFLFRCMTVVLGMVLHLLATMLMNRFLPQGVLEYAPTVLLVLLVVMLAVGALKIFVGAALATINPIIGALYTFFFANMVGKMLSKAILTTAMLTALVWGLNYIGLTSIAVTAAALIAYIPFLVILAIVWYVVNQIL